MMSASIPDLDKLISGFDERANVASKPKRKPEPEQKIEAESNHEPESAASSEGIPAIPLIDGANLWDTLLEMLEHPRTKDESPKIYMIDSDIIETLNLCDFNASKTHVINSILRLFLVTHIKELNRLRKQTKKTLFDNYLNKQ